MFGYPTSRLETSLHAGGCGWATQLRNIGKSTWESFPLSDRAKHDKNVLKLSTKKNTLWFLCVFVFPHLDWMLQLMVYGIYLLCMDSMWWFCVSCFWSCLMNHLPSYHHHHLPATTTPGPHPGTNHPGYKTPLESIKASCSIETLSQEVMP